MVTLVILTVLSLVIAAWWIVARHRDRPTRDRLDPLPLFSTGGALAVGIPRPGHSPPQSATREGSEWSSTECGEPSISRFRPTGAPVVRTREATAPVFGGTLSPRGVYGSSVGEPEDPIGDGVLGEPVEGASVRYWRPADGTLQFLPGRLEVVAGRDAGQEIRFVRTPGPDGARVTFGRAEGPPYRHVQLREPTVSRAHARMALEPAPGAGSGAAPGGGAGGGGAGWRLENLSATNPVVVNGRALAGDGGPGGSVLLRDGDRIEMGEVAFIFYAR